MGNGGVLFGVGVEKTGISVTYGIVMGLTALWDPSYLCFESRAPFRSYTFHVLVGVALLLVGVFKAALAGVRRDKLMVKVSTTAGSIKIGVLIAVTSGVLSAFLNVGFSNAAPVAEIALNQYGIGT